MSTEKVALPPKVRKLAAWAEQEIRELDELCRGQIPDYDSLGSVEMGHLKALKEIAGGDDGEIEDPKEFLKDVYGDLESIHLTLMDYRTLAGMDALVDLKAKLEKEISR